MAITRREFTIAGIGTATSLAMGVPALGQRRLMTRAIPSSGEEIPIVGVGTNRYGVGDDQAARVPLRESLARFFEVGGTLIDTAPMYRSSETVLGDLIADLAVGEDLFMATKVDREGPDAIRERFDRSFRLLGLQKVDLMQCHNLIDWQNALPAMRDLKAAGRVRYIGITTSMERQYDQLEQILHAHELDFLQINYSLANQRLAAERLLPLAADRGMAVLLNRPFGGGGVFSKLANVDMPDWAADFDCTSWGQFLLKYALSHPAVTAVIPGMTKVRHVDDNMQAAMGRMPSPELRQRQETFFDAL
ncbi:MAG: aldo/keto reductase [Pseudomonadota bacterium]